MKKYLILLFSISYIFCFAQKNNLTINLSNIKVNAGTVRIAVHDRKNFLKNSYTATSILPAKSNNMTVSFSLPKGEYALAISQDYNGNTIMDKNFMGVPKESYVFSNSARPKFRAPTFDEAKLFIDDKKNTVQNLKLENW